MPKMECSFLSSFAASGGPWAAAAPVKFRPSRAWLSLLPLPELGVSFGLAGPPTKDEFLLWERPCVACGIGVMLPYSVASVFKALVEVNVS